MTQKIVPEIIKSVGFDFRWSEEKVWALDIPTESLDITELSWHFDMPFWNKDDNYYNLKPSEVINLSKDNQSEYDRTMQADLTYPIDIMYNKGRWLILDGLHRLLKAHILGQTVAQVRKIPRNLIPQIEK